MALEVVKRENRRNFKAPITIFTEPQEALVTLQQISPSISSNFLRDLIHRRTIDLKNAGHIVTIRWIPSHGATGTFLAKIGVTETPKCWWCGKEEQSVEHLYTKCRKWRRQRRKLIRSLSAKKVNWQGWTERKGLAKLAVDEGALGPLVELLKKTELGSRAVVREREREG